MTYTEAAVLGVALAAVLDLGLLRTRMLGRRVFWTAEAIVVSFQLATNGVLTGRRVFVYDPRAILGIRVASAPVEDLVFGFALSLSTLALWVWWGRRERDRAGRPASRGRVR